MELKRYEWVEKYRPRSLSGVVGHPKGLDELVSWAQSWARGIPKNKAVLLYGRAGIGKTTAAYALANDMKWDVVELNASDQRTAKMIDKIAGAASQNSLLDMGIEEGKKGVSKEGEVEPVAQVIKKIQRRLILLDEADNLHGNADRGGEKAIIELIKKSTQPIILTANEYYDMSIGLRNACLPIQFTGIKIGTIIGILKRIADTEGVICGLGVLETIAENANGDLRGAINDLQAIAEGKGREVGIVGGVGKIKIDINDVKTGTGERDFKENIFKVLEKIFKGTDYIEAYESTFGIDQNPEEFINWIDENLPLEYTIAGELDKGFHYLSRAAIFLGRVRRRQDYGMWRYAGFLMSAGINVAKKGSHGGFTKFQTPTYWQKLGQTRGKRGVRDSLAKKIGAKCHVSSAYVKSDLFYFFKVLSRDSRYNASIAASLGLEKEEIAFILDEDLKSEKVINIYDHSKLLIEEDKEHDIEIFGGFAIKDKIKDEGSREKDIKITEKKSKEDSVKIFEKEKDEISEKKGQKQISLSSFQVKEPVAIIKEPVKEHVAIIKEPVKEPVAIIKEPENKFYDDLFILIINGISASKKGEIAAPIESIIDEAKKSGEVYSGSELIKKIESVFKSKNITIEITKDRKFMIFRKVR